MTLTLQNVLSMVWRSITNAREGAEEILALGIPREAIWPFLFLVVVLSAILGQITTFLMVGIAGAETSGLLAMPIATGAIQLGVLLASIYVIYFVGRGFGGTGSVEETTLLMAWLQFVMVCVQVVQTVFLLIAPALGGMIGILAVALFLWLLTNFVAVIHGFKSLGQVFAMILVSMIVIAFALSILLSIIGFTPPGPTI